MGSKRSKSPERTKVRKISPRTISSRSKTPPCTEENWTHLVNIVIHLLKEKQVKDAVVSDLASRIRKVESSLDKRLFLITMKMLIISAYVRYFYRQDGTCISSRPSSQILCSCLQTRQEAFRNMSPVSFNLPSVPRRTWFGHRCVSRQNAFYQHRGNDIHSRYNNGDSCE